MRSSTVTDLSTLPAVLCVQEVAEILRMSRSQAYEWIRQGVIPHVRMGASVRVPKAALEAWLMNRCERPQASQEGYSVPHGPSMVKGGDYRQCS